MLNENKHSESLIGYIILNAVQKHERSVGVGTLALILKGSGSKHISRRQLNNSPFFGALIYCSISDIEYILRQLIEQGLLERYMVQDFRYPIPVLQLTEHGRRILEQKEEIHLKLHTIRPQTTSNSSAEETFTLFQQTRNITQVAEQRQLAKSTIWNYLISCVASGKLRAEEFVSSEKKALIEETQRKLQATRAKPLKEQLPADISYEEIRCVLAEMGIK